MSASAAAPEAEVPDAGARPPARPKPLRRGEGPWRTLRQVITLAGATFREAVRMKAFAAPVVFAATAAAAGPFLPSDGTPAGAVRLAISVSLVTASIFGTFAAVMLPSLLAAREARDRTAYLVATKPVPRSCLFLGRALGLSCVMAVMFAGMAVLSWVFVRYAVTRESRRGEAARAEAAEVLVERTCFGPEWERGAVRAPCAGPMEPVTLAPGESRTWRFSLPPLRVGTRGFEGRVVFPDGAPTDGLIVRAINPRTGEVGELDLVAPAAVPAPQEPGTAWLNRRPGPTGHPRRPHSFFVPAGLVDADPENPRIPGMVAVEIENRSSGPVELVKSPPVVVLAGSYVSIPPGGAYTWQFRLRGKGRRRPAFRLTTHRDWTAAVGVTLEFRGAGDSSVRSSVVLGTRPLATLEVPPELVAARLSSRRGGQAPKFTRPGGSEGGFVTAVLRNDSDSPVRLPTGRGLVFAPAAGTFAGALARWTLLETSKAALIVIVTCAAATFLTFPVPALAGGAVAVGGYLMAFVSRLLASAGDGAGVGRFGLSLFLRLLLPDLTGPSVAGRIADGAFVPAGFIAACAAWLVLVRGGVIGLIGAALSARREVGV